MEKFRNVRGSQKEIKKEGFKKKRPLISAVKRMGYAIAGFAAFSLTAIFGATLGTYFSYRYHNHDYSEFPNRTKMNFSLEGNADNLIKLALETAKLKVIGSKPPQSAELFIKITKGDDGVRLLTRHVMVWGHSHIIEKRDEEEVAIKWRYDEKKNRFIPEEGSTRYHYKNVVFGLREDEQPVIVIQNPAHTPGIPGSVPFYADTEPGIIDAFTMFSAEKWAGSCLSTGLPGEFSSLEVPFSVRIETPNFAVE